MAKARYTEKLERSLRLLMGLRHPEVREALAPHSLTDEIVAHGWELLTRAGMSRVESVPLPGEPGMNQDAVLIAELEAFQDRWFPITRIALTANYPQLGEMLAPVLVKLRGAGLPFNVQRFLDRLPQLEQGDPDYGPDAQAARALLERRGLTKELEEQTRRTVDTWMKPSRTLSTSPNARQAEDAAAARLWAFYLEWSGIAQKSLENGEHLRRLGLGRKRAKSGAKKKKHGLRGDLNARSEQGPRRLGDLSPGAVPRSIAPAIRSRARPCRTLKRPRPAKIRVPRQTS